jgi:hypothetical protein
MFTYFVSYYLYPKQGTAGAYFDAVVDVPEPITDKPSFDQLKAAVRQYLLGTGVAEATEGALCIVNFIVLKSPGVGVS